MSHELPDRHFPTAWIPSAQPWQGTCLSGNGADAEIHGNQQGTVHGGLLSELADAAIGTAHSTVVEGDESFTSIDLRINFFRPVWRATLMAKASPVRRGRTVSHYQCEIIREDGKQVALAAGTIMTLRGPAAHGR
ncbi:PaaI family thioesterase [Sulfuricystis multivorans]|uniref:PaaI family thioesterase n=1 Tax=Sulfuricystis multivorans TaxID=2211108 RepID=UPI0024DFEC0D|nr:PaaI family thioesterase [Sulfuricystis multivorans]